MKLFVIFVLVSFSSFVFAATPLNKERLRLGKLIYERTCISCHGVDGKTDPHMKLVVKPRQLSKTILLEEQEFQIIKHGAHYWGAHSDIMPAFKYIYSDQEIQNIAYYIWFTFNKKIDTKIATLINQSQKMTPSELRNADKVGEKIFKKKCAKCHGKLGDGKSEYIEKSKKENDFIYPYNLARTLLTEDQVFLYVKYGGLYWGTHKDDMPAWKRKYNDAEIRSVAHYVKTKMKQLSNKK